MYFADHKPGNPNYGNVAVDAWAYDSPYNPSLLGGDIYQWTPPPNQSPRMAGYRIVGTPVIPPPPPDYWVLNDGVTKTWKYCLENTGTQLCDGTFNATWLRNCRVDSTVYATPLTPQQTGGPNLSYFAIQFATHLDPATNANALPGPRTLSCDYIPYGNVENGAQHLTLDNALYVYDATPAITPNVMTYAPDPNTGEFYISIYGSNLGAAGSISIQSDSTGSVSDFQVSYTGQARFSTWSNTQVNVLLTPLVTDTSDTYEVTLTSSGASGAGFVALAAQSTPQSKPNKINVIKPLFVEFVSAAAAASFRYDLYCPDLPMGAFGIEKFKILDQSNQSFMVAGLVVQEQLLNQVTIAPDGTKYPSDDSGWVTPQRDPTGAPNGLVIPTSSDGTFTDGPFGGCGPLPVTYIHDHAYRVQFRNQQWPLTPIFHQTLQLGVGSITVTTTTPGFNWFVSR